MALLGMLSPEKSETLKEVYFTENDGERRDIEKVFSEYDKLRGKLKREAVDADSFERTTSLKKKKKDRNKTTSNERINIGDTITFGRYPQNAEGNDQTPIEWQILKVKEGKALLISKYGMDCKCYHEKRFGKTWEHCSLRKWLNDKFIQEVFNLNEQGRICLTTVPANRNPRLNTPPGNATIDKVFLLSIHDVEEYFKSDNDRRTIPTAYAKKQGACTSYNNKITDGKSACEWWLRTPGASSNAMLVSIDGSVDYFGFDVKFDSVCVRPALWINLES